MIKAFYQSEACIVPWRDFRIWIFIVFLSFTISSFIPSLTTTTNTDLEVKLIPTISYAGIKLPPAGTGSIYNFKAIAQEQQLPKAAYPLSTSKPNFWCASVEGTGLLYNKVPKSASSTVVSVVLRIKDRISHRFFTNKHVCRTSVKHHHNYTAGENFLSRDRKRSFLLGSIRNPAARAMSRVFHLYVTQAKLKPTDENVLKWLNVTHSHYGSVSPGMGGFQLAYLSMHKLQEYSGWDPSYPTNVSNPGAIYGIVKDIMADYDMIIVTERLSESLVALQLILDLKTTDILYLSSKVGGKSYIKGKFTKLEKGKCTLVKKTSVSPAISKYLLSKEWYAKSFGDYLLQETASLSLDLTIEALGQERFHEALLKFENLNKRAKEECTSKADYPCSKDGNLQRKISRESCYKNDFGCGHRCLDTFEENY